MSAQLTDEDRKILATFIGDEYAAIISRSNYRAEVYLAGKRAGAEAMRERAAKSGADAVRRWMAAFPLADAMPIERVGAMLGAIRALEVGDE